MTLPHFLSGGATVGELMRSHPWTDTPVGSPDRWPVALQTIVQIMLSSNQPMFVAWGPDRTFLYNDAYLPILGGKHPAALGMPFLDVWREIRAEIGPLVNRAFDGEPVQMDDIQLVLHRNGYPEETHFSFFYSPIQTADGSVAGIFCAVTERTSEVMAQRELQEREARHRGVLANMDEGFLLLDADFRVTEINDYALRLNGRRRADMIGRTHWELFPGSEKLEVGQLYMKAMAERSSHTLEHLYEWPDGRKAWIELRIYPSTGGVAAFFRDVTARREIERRALEAAERVDLALAAGAIVGTWVWDIPTNQFVADERFARSFGVDAEVCRQGVPLEYVFESIHPDDRAHVQQAIDSVMRLGGPYRCEYRVRQQDGTYHLIEANGRCELGPDGRPLRFPGVLLDIEDRRRAEVERDQANALLRTFIEAVPGVVYAKDRQGRLLLANKGTADLIGKAPESFIGKTDLEVLDDKDKARVVMETDRRIMDSARAEQIEEMVPLPNGEPAYWLSHKAPLFDAERRVVGLVGASVDITQRMKEQERARNEAEMLDVLNQTGAKLAGELDLEVLLQSVTDAATRLTGARFGAFFYNGTDARGEAYSLYTLSGAPREAFEAFGHPRPTPVFEPTFRGGPPVRIDDVMKDPRYGRLGPHHGMPAGHLPVRSYLAVSVTSRRGDVIGGLFFGHPEPGVFTERSERLAVGIAAQAAVAIDNARLYTEAQRAAQERTLLLESERAARGEAERASTLKDEFLATLSHELRTPLSAILGWTHILRLKAGNDPTLVKGVEVIERSTRVQTQLIGDLLDMSRITSGKLHLELQPVSPQAIVQAAVDAVRPAADAAGVKVVTRLDGTLTTVMADASRLQQIVWNLLTNAIKFSPAGGTVTVDVGARDDQVRIEVADAGVGIAPEFLPHIFERFRQADGSTTRRFGGLGLGLSIVRHLVEMHGGTVKAESEGKDRGATFVLTLPSGDSRESRAGCEPSDLARGNVDLQGLAILVVDDEPDVLDLLTRLLTEANAEVHPASNAQAAIGVFHERRPRLVISDIGMPGMDGYELIRTLRRAEAPGRLPAIALTAFARPEDRSRALESGFDSYLSKPVEPYELLAQIRKLAAP
ncbi:MAG TPA: PAS domain-containing protein [Ramlibacter sp.]|nr:PAS domain-containing protein [Ramlibacter sp.]